MTTFLIWFAAIAGNCKLWSEFANRVHAKPWQCRTLRRIRWLHDIGLLGFPFLLTWGLWKCDWSFSALVQRSFASWFILLACAIGFLWLLFDAVRHWLRTSPSGAEHLSTEFHNVTIDHSELPVPTGDGDRSYWAALPFNELFHLEVTHKRLALPGYSATPLRILHLTDWHFSGTPGKPYYDYATELIQGLEFDVVVFTGDLIDRMHLVEWIDSTLGQIRAPLGQHFILGNHDWFVDHQRVREILTDAGWTDAAGRVQTIQHGDQRIALAGNERPWMGEVPDLVASDADLRFALIHTPDLFGWAREQDANLVLAGHNHGGQVVLPLIGPVYSPSRHGVKYAAGIFQRGETLMHVGRGLGGVHPVRWRCRPEITVLEIVGPANESSQASGSNSND